MTIVCLCQHRHRNLIAVPSLKQPWSKRRVLDAEKRAMKELAKEMKEAKDREKEVCVFVILQCLLLGIYDFGDIYSGKEKADARKEGKKTRE